MKIIDPIIRFSLKNKLLILLGAVLLIAGGIFSIQRMDIDVFPDLTAPTAVIMTDAHGMAAEEVERLVTFPIETAVNGATDVRRVRSSSGNGFSFVWVEFDWGTDVFRARQIISEKMVALGSGLPEGLFPVLAPQSSVMGEILFIGMQSDSTSMMEVRTLAEWVVKPAILSTGGVSQVSILGGEYKQYQILADPLKMKAYGVSLDEVADVGRNFSCNSEGGIINDFGNEYTLRGIARTNDLEMLGRSLIKKDGERSIRLSDVAEIRIGSAVRTGAGSRNAQAAVILSVSKQPNINTLEVTEKIEKNLESVQASLPQDVRIDTHIFRQSDFISAAVDNVTKALIEGSIFVILVLFFFLNSFRTTLISVVAIPLSLLGSIIVMHLLGMDINTMTLGGMCIAIGSLVDDAIIDVENVYKRLKQNHALPVQERRSAFDVVFEASSEIRSSIINATLIIMVAFIPLFFLSGMEGRLLKPLGIAYIISLFMSLIVAMTVTPLLCKMLLGEENYLEKNKREKGPISKISDAYRSSLKWVLGHKRTVIGSTLLLFVTALVVFLCMGRSFLPDFNEGSMTISAVTQAGVSLDVSDQLGNRMEKELLKIPEITSTARRTGRGELDEHSQTTNSCELDVNFKLKNRKRDEVFDDVRHRLNAIPGVAVTVGQPLGHRIDHMMSGTRASIAIKIFGNDLSRLYMIGNQIKDATSGIEGLVDVSVEQQIATPQIQIRAQRDALARYGISIEEFNHFVNLGFAGEKLGEIYEGQRSFDVILRLNERYTGSMDGIRKSLIDAADGQKVPLEEVAEVVSASGPAAISRENVQRKLVVSANVSGRDVGSVVDEIQKTIRNEIQLPEGYRIEYGGQFENARTASRTLAVACLLSVFVIFLLLYGEFKNVPLSAIILLNLPLAMIGGVFAVCISSGVVSIPSIIGFITLLGIAVRNGVLLISRYNYLSNTGMPLRQVIFNGSADRLNPILMTALTSALALIPLIVNGDKSGNEIQSPMAIVVLGGLLTSTLLNIYIMPIMYEYYQKNQKRKIENGQIKIS